MRPTSRREFLKSVSATAAFSLPWASTLARADLGPLGIPDFTHGNVLRSVAGLRPVRAGGMRLEVENYGGGKTVVHNYGHGGSGFTLAWGSAAEAADLVRTVAPPGRPVAVVGGGVIGLTTAACLAERGYKVTIYAAQFSPHTTSDLAGAQWSPSFIEAGRTPAERARYARIVANSFKAYAKFAGAHYGVYLRPNYLPDGFHDGLQDIPAEVIGPARRLPRLPLAGPARAGVVFQSWLIEPPRFLPALAEDLRASRVTFQTQEFRDSRQLASLSEDVIVNCCGLGSARLFGDRDLSPMKGQLVWLKPKAGLDYVVLHKGYIFCRSDAIVLGGSYERGNWDTQVDPAVSDKILTLNREFFGN